MAARTVAAKGDGPGSWQAEAIALQHDVWSAVYEPDADSDWLAARADWVLAAREAAAKGRPAPPQVPERSARIQLRHSDDPHYDVLRSGRPQPSEAGSMARVYAEERVTG